ncbi:hypothetical protein PHLGIDRAFT_121451 [Phlebiopsis gigantea 11061_1 CR5-6]|uniref:Uncharacterized protein n=1 Tax=Phlebiopsis gigantea (strain 11061_1 CR5-6) TaxID=745531 RepID=A0A0C3S5L0_PHLG1|nr:hypothetical protein PHLGIDRAFT_121451 [Phlebiopsis gigantea 11061_1 CR5-6]
MSFRSTSRSPPPPPTSAPPPSYHAATSDSFGSAPPAPTAMVMDDASGSALSYSNPSQDEPGDLARRQQRPLAMPSLPILPLPVNQDVTLRWTSPTPIPDITITAPVTYTFSQLGCNTMLLLPPPDQPDSRPIYHISVEMNCLTQASIITTLRRGSSEHGIYVGEFEYL